MGYEVIGPVVGAHPGAGSAAPAAGAGGPNEFEIGQLSFPLAISDERPYERATAPFRKEQFDSSPIVGDQSLIGFWTRGQMSFHNGAGVTYYELLQGEEVIDRFNESYAVDPFTPGELSLARAWDAAEVFTNISEVSGSEGYRSVLDSGVVKYTTSPTAGAWTSVTPVSGTAGHIAAGPSGIFFTTSVNKIERAAVLGGSSGVLYTHNTGLKRIWYAKDRLFVLDVTGSFYQLAANPAAPPVAIAAADRVFVAGDSWTGQWSLTETPSAVFIGNGSRIFAVTIGNDGSVPSLRGPVQVADLPTGENVQSLAYHLGFLVILTSTGVRIGVVSDAGGVTYGPVLIELAGAGSTVARIGESAIISASSSLYEISLARQIGDSLEFGWAQLSSPASGVGGGTFTALGRAYAWWSTGVSVRSTKYAPSGTLTTGFHRFATLERKKFHRVRVRVSGAGTVGVAKVLADGTEVSLLTLDTTTTDGEEISLSMDEPVEMAGLKFTLATTDPAQSPVLLGYQLLALPAPRRQRMIRVPLLLMDRQRQRPQRGVGYRGMAWENLSALEEMESTGGIFRFADLRTGESGQCYIESVEHQGTTAPSVNSSGFGGYVFLTIRKLD